DTRVSVGLRTKFGAGLSTFSGANASRLAFQASLAAVDTQRRAINERVQGDYYLVASFGSQLPALRSAASTTEAVFNSYHRQYLAGRKTWFDLLNSARDLVQSKIQLADAEAAYLVVNWRLAILTQGLEQLMETKD
ncbi:TolC family protein, partial [Methyloprofundus sp.]|uniref:TolC family protein n=1 Tax=Methyloprofundus sp. TaxID=2020875 RepID=UPI002629344C